MAKQAQMTPVIPVSPNAKEAFVPQSEKLKAEVVFGSNSDFFQIDKGAKLSQVLADVRIKEAIGYGSTGDNLMMIINGELTNGDHEISDADMKVDPATGEKTIVIELIRPAGEKA